VRVNNPDERQSRSLSTGGRARRDPGSGRPIGPSRGRRVRRSARRRCRASGSAGRAASRSRSLLRVRPRAGRSGRGAGAAGRQRPCAQGPCDALRRRAWPSQGRRRRRGARGAGGTANAGTRLRGACIDPPRRSPPAQAEASGADTRELRSPARADAAGRRWPRRGADAGRRAKRHAGVGSRRWPPVCVLRRAGATRRAYRRAHARGVRGSCRRPVRRPGRWLLARLAAGLPAPCEPWASRSAGRAPVARENCARAARLVDSGWRRLGARRTPGEPSSLKPSAREARARSRPGDPREQPVDAEAHGAPPSAERDLGAGERPAAGGVEATPIAPGARHERRRAACTGERSRRGPRSGGARCGEPAT
jgi:hypothetical protein